MKKYEFIKHAQEAENRDLMSRLAALDVKVETKTQCPRELNTELKVLLRRHQPSLPTDESTRKKHFERVIHRPKNNKDFLASGF